MEIKGYTLLLISVVRDLVQANFIPLLINRLEKEIEDAIVVCNIKYL